MSQNRRIYEGPYNNRIDRVPQVGNSFKVEGVPNHVLQTDCFISEAVELTRRRHTDIAEVEEKVGADAPDFESVANRRTWKYPEYPNIPQIPKQGDVCPDPYVLHNINDIEFRRWALNKSFDNVQWRTETSRNSHKCEIFDTCELQPWLSHADCTADILRPDKPRSRTKFWRDLNTGTDIDDFQVPDCVSPWTMRSRALHGTWPFAEEQKDVWADEQKIDEASAALNPTSTTGQNFATEDLTFTWNDENNNYEIINAPITAAAVGLANNNAFANSLATFWVDKYYYDVDGTRHAFPGAKLNLLLSCETTKVQLDGFCYFCVNKKLALPP